MGIAASKVTELHEFERLGHLVFPFVSRQVAHLQRKSDVFGYSHVRKERVALEHHADVAPVRRELRDVPPADDDAPGAWRLKAGYHGQKRRLSRARGPKDRNEFSSFDLKRHASNRGMGAILLTCAVDEYGGTDQVYSSYRI
ncbi:hypothetical protein GGD56_000685 [Rhizobium mongolense]|uniref:Uncharacterized protein n=2 Tax=Rhizobium mongolense TaxID=57676 RepID=A0ABR6IGI7_9HYPH|nr:hypothetical protein [Rhizobium mongolense]TVZ74084.1 hypothetical protein BCL32_2395 [Rhizobium mongolense USDA 1844]